MKKVSGVKMLVLALAFCVSSVAMADSAKNYGTSKTITTQDSVRNFGT